MNMYRDSYALALMVGGNIQKESDDGTVLIPFGSEYSLRLKNKLRKRAVADVFIDGKLAAKGIVIPATETVDLERFVEDGQLSEGKKFKLVRVDDPKVEQPNDSENGIIEVNFYPEKDAPIVEKTVIHEYKHSCHQHNTLGHCSTCCLWVNCWTCRPQPMWGGNQSGGIVYTSGTTTTNLNVTSSGGITVNNASTTQDWATSNDSLTTKSLTASAEAGQMMAMNASMSVGEAAATVQGSTSLQKFASVYIDVDRSNPVTLRLKVKGLAKVLEACPECGYKRKKDVKFCPSDGTQLVA